MALRRLCSIIITAAVTGVFLTASQAYCFTPSPSAGPLIAKTTGASVAGPYTAGIISFRGSVENGVVTLKWETATETNCHGFEIEKKTGVMGTFAKIGSIQGSGTTDEAHTYQFVDIPSVPDRYSYRLRQISADGRSAYSDEVAVTITIEYVRSSHEQ